MTLKIDFTYFQKDLPSSTSEGMRLIKAGGVKIDGEKVSDTKQTVAQNEQFVIQVGKRKFGKIVT